MADEYVSIATLTNYPGVLLSPQVGTNTWVVTMVNALIDEVLAEVIDPTPPSPVPVTVTIIAHNVAARALANPQGYESLTIQIDDYKETSRFRDNSDVGVGVFLTADERAALRAAVTDETTPRRAPGVGSIQLAVAGYPRTNGNY